MKRRRSKDKQKSYKMEAGQELGYFRSTSEVRSLSLLKELWKRLTKKTNGK
ncbi:hypothetical protein [Salibacterium halotolerans]|uniref:Uncharacterized protein n=1 Tax=Salibacterium halotolerans TaxID=1884432 RepID=A0A1I5MBR2_9BACI|nr:hypothetical protein [Salibacterium halotolerans]SFP06995.1 hypothetical protein SAMN05518683_102177 [Salibacterium halotolerans]